MTTLIAAYDSDGCKGRCDARCYDAVGGECDCICGGKNHGVGINQAIQNTQELVDEMIKNYSEAKNFNPSKVEVFKTPAQMTLF